MSDSGDGPRIRNYRPHRAGDNESTDPYILNGSVWDSLWGTAGRPVMARRASEQSGDEIITATGPDGRQWVRAGQYKIPVDGTVYNESDIYMDPVYGQLISPESQQRAKQLYGHEDVFDKYGPLLAAAGLGAVAFGPALAGGAAAGGGAAATGAGVDSGLAMELGSAGVGGGGATTAGEFSLGSAGGGSTLGTGGYSSLSGSLTPGAASIGEGVGVGGLSSMANPYSLASGVGGAGISGAGFGAGAGTIGGLTSAAAMGGAATAATQGGSFWESIFKALAPSATGGPGASVAGSVVGGLLEAYGADRARQAIEENTAAATKMGIVVPQSERDFYQAKQRQLWEGGPGFMESDPGFQAGKNAIAARNNKLGLAFSGNNATDLVNFGLSKRNEISNTLAPLGGFQFGPGQAAQIQATGGADAIKQGQNTLAGIGYAARPIINRASDYLANQIFV